MKAGAGRESGGVGLQQVGVSGGVIRDDVVGNIVEIIEEQLEGW